MAESAYQLSLARLVFCRLYIHTACEETRKQWVRLRNEQDCQLLNWLIETLGEVWPLSAPRTW